MPQDVRWCAERLCSNILAHRTRITLNFEVVASGLSVAPAKFESGSQAQQSNDANLFIFTRIGTPFRPVTPPGASLAWLRFCPAGSGTLSSSALEIERQLA